MEGVMLYLKVVKVFNISTNNMYFYGFAWGKKKISDVQIDKINFLLTILVHKSTLCPQFCHRGSYF